jgi:hypothetical protein
MMQPSWSPSASGCDPNEYDDFVEPTIFDVIDLPLPGEDVLQDNTDYNHMYKSFKFKNLYDSNIHPADDLH